ncbi:ABC transporter permease subunit [Phytoactinopolyspora mesophila]|uniref:ABC transporter permease subunit n=1 Tax=Phytoactinopolyspora mesophila TaxID=2650750 RepID=A0A7K3LXI6_9ACTN|nr:ABC transporter permease subunit [Phytoactinopolyspora mesophila]NDL55749.1 ABC transporter permease subunit [Phytoactinopolyspora mesophila]
MMWLAWRQFRVHLIVGAASLSVIAVYLVTLGTQIRDTYDGYLVQCESRGNCAELMSQFHREFRDLLLFLNGGLLFLLPAVLGLFWGAPLIARELENGTHRLAWNQSVTRRRWFAVKLLVVGLATLAVSGLVSALLTWAASPVDDVAGDRFTALVFGARDIVPVAYAVFAVILGVVLGILVRRTLAAMALTLLIFVVVQVVTPNMVRPHMMAPVTLSKPMTAEAIIEGGAHSQGLGGLRNEPTVKGVTIPDAWVTSHSELRTSDGQPLDMDRFDECLSTGNEFDDAAHCLGDLDLHVEVAYQPNDRYWSFQWIESAIFFALSAALAGIGAWRIRRNVT